MQDANEIPSDNLELSAEPVDPYRAFHHVLMVECALGNMSDVQREAVEMTYLEGLPFKAAAEKLEVPSGTVRTRVFYGLAAARAAFYEMGLSADDVIG